MIEQVHAEHDNGAEHIYNEMAKGHEGIGRGILFTQGLAEWFDWASGVLRGGVGVQRRVWGKHELPKPYDEIVILFANIIQEVK